MSPDSSILAITSEVPWPLDSGGHLRSYHLLRAVAADFPVSLVAGTSRHVDSMSFDTVGIDLRPVQVAPRTLLSEARRVAAAALRREPYVCFRRHDQESMRAAVRAELSRRPPALLYLDHLDSVVFADVAAKIPKILDLHNVYSELVRRTAEEGPGIIRPYLRREARLLERMERRAVRLADAVFTVSERDRQYFQAFGGPAVHLIPNGVDCAHYADLPAGVRSGTPLILYIGTLSWGPNAAAVEYLVREILPRVRVAVPDARLRIIGRAPSASLLKLTAERGVEILGDVDDVRPHLHAAHVLAVPLESGGGSRLKILEAFAAGVPVASTLVGAEGLEVKSEEHLLIAPRPDLARAVVRLLQDAALANSLAAHARALVTRRYDWNVIGRDASSIVAGVLDRSRTAASR